MSYPVAVRALCEFAAREGDLDLRYQAAPSAEEGIAGHARVSARRGDGYQHELGLQGMHGTLLVRGRADGYDPARNRLEEIKTHRGAVERIPANQRALHWAQLKVYGCLLCRELELPDVELALVYFDIASERETVLLERQPAQVLEAFFGELCQRFIGWAEQEISQRQARDVALTGLTFPYPDFRPGQRRLAETLYKVARREGRLLAQAPTGIGKTLGSLFPLLKAMPQAPLDRLFFLTAKTPGRQLALDALQQLGGAALPLRVLELGAREKLCEHPDKLCQGDSCPLARGFYDRLPAARQACVEARWLDHAGLRRIAAEHQVCPYYLGQELARWVDVCVGDYNHYFDSSALLHGLTLSNQWKVALLVDEAHNLVERARRMYSAELRGGQLAAARQSAPTALKKPLERIARQWSALQREQGLTALRETTAGGLFEPPPVRHYAVAPLPGALLAALQQFSAAFSEWQQQSAQVPPTALLEMHFLALQFCRLAEQFDDHSLFDLSLPAQGKRADLCLRNLLPAPFLAPRFASARSAVLFSATLGPQHYYRDLLGLGSEAAWLEIAAPFASDQLQVSLASISTRYADRQSSLQPITDLIAAQYARAPGNYLVFCSSFDYLQQIAARLATDQPQIPCWSQGRSMDEAARAAFLARFVAGGRGIGLAVLGGAFGEGIDLPGERLIGAFIATLGLPQLNPVNEQMRQRLQQLFGQGHDYTYLYPGLQKVIQAAGRVIRGPQDRGTLHLIDDRFGQPRIRALLPGWWGI